MSQYRSGSSDYRTQKSTRSIPSGGAFIISAAILGLCILIAGLSIGGALRTLNKTIAGKEFSSSFDSPDKISVRTAAERKYLDQNEAADYLNISPSEISSAIAAGKIEDYIITSEGYSISVESLDAYFEAEAYEIKMKKNSADNS